MPHIVSVRKLFALAASLVALAAQAADYQTGAAETKRATAELITDAAALRPGQTFEIGLKLNLHPHWHVYWKNPGDAGQAPAIQWTAPEGFVFGELEFPAPHRIPTDPFVSYGYEDEVVFLTKVTAPAALSGSGTVSIKADAKWLVCEDSCLQDSAKLALELPFNASGESLAPSASAAQVAAARAAIPPAASGGSLWFEVLQDSVTVGLKWAGLKGADLTGAYFYVEQDSVVDSAKPQTFQFSGDSLTVSLAKNEFFEEGLARLSGMLYSPAGFPAADGAKAVYFDSGDGKAAASAGAEVATSGAAAVKLGFGKALLFAFVGGMILNLMPCVFPVLSIKILGFAQQAGEDKAKILKHGLVFGAGVLLSFWALAGTMLALRAGGERIGWGFQLQDPRFVVALIVVMFVFGLSLAGVFEIGGSAIGLAGKVKGTGLGGSFFSGVLATAVATPCTGPFMGPALGLIATLSAGKSMLLFTFLGLGMAAPYVLLSAFPEWIKKLPRPGAWMETFKQAMAFPMFATCVWLLWVLGAHVGSDGLAMALGGLVAIAIAAWIYGKWSAPHREALTRGIAKVLAVAVGAVGIYLMLPSEASAQASDTKAGPDEYGVTWEAYSPELVERLRGEGRKVFIDFTAKWCLTCKANKFAVLTSDAARERFESLDVAMVKADWTRNDPVITAALESFGRSGVPLYVLYDGSAEPVVLPELLTPGLVIDALNQLESN